MLRPTGQLQRASQQGALFALWLLCLICQPVWAEECLSFRADEWVEVAHVYDGDTVKLTDGRKLRLIGINTPEIGYDGAQSEPMAQQARQALIAIVEEHSRLALRYEGEKKDRHGRLLAHVYLPDQTNLQQLLLQQGMAISVAVAPNLANVECYLAAERLARGQGIWRFPRYQGIETTQLPADAKGFQVIRGKVVRLGESRKAYWLNFAGNVAARIDKRDLHNFAGQMDPAQLQGKTVRLRGWLYEYKGQKQMRISHPAALELL